jgi:hypothetical protein
MSGNLCRCGAYNGIVKAIEEARDEMSDQVGHGSRREACALGRAATPRRADAPPGSVSLERERQLAADGSRLGRARAASYRGRREQRARALSFDDLVSFYRARYVDRRLRFERVATELGTRWGAVRCGIRCGVDERSRSPCSPSAR